MVAHNAETLKGSELTDFTVSRGRCDATAHLANDAKLRLIVALGGRVSSLPTCAITLCPIRLAFGVSRLVDRPEPPSNILRNG